MEPTPQEFGEWLAAERRRLRVSLEAVARHANMSNETVRKAEAGERVRATTRDAIEDALYRIDAITQKGGGDLKPRVEALEAECAALTRELAGLRGDVTELLRARSPRGRRTGDPQPAPEPT